MFKNRKDAGKKLAGALSGCRDQDPLVLAIPRGGVPVGYEVAKALGADFSLLIVQKLPFPFNTKESFGAVAEGGRVVVLAHASRNLDQTLIDQVIADQIKEIKRRRRVLRTEHAIPALTGRTVILVDDGIKLGVTMKAAVRYVNARGPEKIVVAAPVSSPEAANAFEHMPAVDSVVILEKPRFFHDIAQVYTDWGDVGDHNVMQLVQQWQESPI
jgi:predicted phosphoribosyltransferase